MLLEIYKYTVIFAIVSSIFYVIRYFKYDMKHNPDKINLDVIAVIIMILLLCIPIVNIAFGYMYLYYGVIADEEEFKKIMEEEL